MTGGPPDEDDGHPTMTRTLTGKYAADGDDSLQRYRCNAAVVHDVWQAVISVE